MYDNTLEVSELIRKTGPSDFEEEAPGVRGLDEDIIDNIRIVEFISFLELQYCEQGKIPVYL